MIREQDTIFLWTCWPPSPFYRTRVVPPFEDALELIRDDYGKSGPGSSKKPEVQYPHHRRHWRTSSSKRRQTISSETPFALGETMRIYRKNHISMASLIEFIHTATLLHDDVVDKAQLRRGIESANSKWGNEACVLVGDFLFTKCFTRMVESGNWKILHTISRATTIMAEGELEELIRTNDLSMEEDTYLSIIARKTAYLISAATQIGAVLGKASEEKEEALAQFGMNVGIAFQLIDDNLDYTSR